MGFKLTSTMNQEFEYEVPTPSSIQSFFPFALPKSGSTLLFNMLTEICHNADISIIDIPSFAFTKGVRPRFLTSSIDQILYSNGYAYLGWRYFPSQSNFDFSKVKCSLLVRDPRDMLVSLYFSRAFSHNAPKGEEEQVLQNRKSIQAYDINDWVMKTASNTKSLFEAYDENLQNKLLKIYRYEDVIFRKEKWLQDICKYFNIEVSKRALKAIARRHDIRPTREDPNAHIRSVTPGNYKKHLSEETINFLNQEFAEILLCFNYVKEASGDEPISFYTPEAELTKEQKMDGSPITPKGFIGKIIKKLVG